MAGSLIESWILDRQVSFAAAALQSLALTLGLEAAQARRVLCDFIGAHTADLPSIQLSTRLQMLRIDASIWHTTPTIATALNSLDESEGMPTASDFALLSHGLLLLSTEHIGIESFVKWAKRASPRQVGSNGTTWTSSYWGMFLGKFQKLGCNADVDLSELRAMTDVTGIDAVADRLAELDPIRSDSNRITPWRSLCMGLVSSRFCWPLLGVQMGGVIFGTSLPIGLNVTTPRAGGGTDDVSFRCRRLDGTPARYVAGDTHPQMPEQIDRFNEGNLAWDLPFKKSFINGLKVAKQLWRSQNGRAPVVKRNLVMRKSLVADLTFAKRVSDIPKLSEVLLYGQSAELHLSQMLLARFLEASLPSGLATGLVDLHRPSMSVRWVDEIEAKLEFPLREGTFPRVILPGVAARRLAQEIRDKLHENHETGRMEVNYCPTARSAADAMQRAGWRRTTFLRGAEERFSFYSALGRLHANAVLDGQASEDEFEPDPDIQLQTGAPKPFPPQQLSAFKRQTDDWLLQGRAVRWFQLPPTHVSPRRVGQWLAWLDHCTRIDSWSETGPGLGILYLRLGEEDNEMRLWSRLFVEMDVNADLWKKFQWSTASQAREILAQVLNNFDCDPSVSITPPPDLIVIVDEGGLTRHRSNKVFDDDFRGQMRDVFTPELGDQLNVRDTARERVLGATRVLLLQLNEASEASCEERPAPKLEIDEQTRVALRRLCVFRSGFSVQAASYVLNKASASDKQLTAVQVRDLLDKMMTARVMGRHRGEYFVRWKYKYAHPQDPANSDEHVAAAQALAPTINPSKGTTTNRDNLFDAWAIHEAKWHLSQAHRTASPRRVNHISQINEASLTLLTLMPHPDWDLIRPLMSIGGSGTIEAGELASELSQVETKVRGKATLVHSSRYALSINALARRSQTDKSESAKLDFAELARNQFVAGWNAIANYLREDAQKVKLLSEYAYFLRSIAPDERTALLADIECRLDSALDQYWRGDRTGRDVPLSRAWLSKRLSDTSRPLSARSKDARIACDLWGFVWMEPWIWHLGQMQPGAFSPNTVSSALVLLNDGWPNKSGTTVTQERISEFRLTAIYPRYRKLGHDAALTLMTWLLNSSNRLTLVAEIIAAHCIKAWIAESHNCFDFAQALMPDFLLDMVLGTTTQQYRFGDQARSVGMTVLADSWGCWSLLARLQRRYHLNYTQSKYLVQRLLELSPEPHFEEGDVITLGDFDARITKNHLPPKVFNTQRAALTWLDSCERNSTDYNFQGACQQLRARLTQTVRMQSAASLY